MNESYHGGTAIYIIFCNKLYNNCIMYVIQVTVSMCQFLNDNEERCMYKCIHLSNSNRALKYAQLICCCVEKGFFRQVLCSNIILTDIKLISTTILRHSF